MCSGRRRSCASSRSIPSCRVSSHGHIDPSHEHDSSSSSSSSRREATGLQVEIKSDLVTVSLLKIEGGAAGARRTPGRVRGSGGAGAGELAPALGRLSPPWSTRGVNRVNGRGLWLSEWPVYRQPKPRQHASGTQPRGCVDRQETLLTTAPGAVLTADLP